MSYIVRQPNGKLCRFSTICDCPTDWNMTDDEYVELCAQKAREEARETIRKARRTIEDMIEDFRPNNMTNQEFEMILKEMGG